jgi:catechol 2,3-dioxygenase-like lactoylglutathione lyase family enzyme
MHHRPLHHVCYVVDDIAMAVDRWVETTGAGPFFHLGEHVAFEETLLEGEPCVFDPDRDARGAAAWACHRSAREHRRDPRAGAYRRRIENRIRAGNTAPS